MESRSMFARACNDTTASLPIVGEIGNIIDSNAWIDWLMVGWPSAGIDIDVSMKMMSCFVSFEGQSHQFHLFRTIFSKHIECEMFNATMDVQL